MRNFILLIAVIMVSSCAQKGYYYTPDKTSTRYGWIGGTAHSATQQNRNGRGDKRFKEPEYNFPGLWNTEATTLVKDEFDKANTQDDVNKMISSGKVFTDRYSNRSLASAESYGNRLEIPLYTGEYETNVVKNAKKVLKLCKKVSKNTNDIKTSEKLQELKHKMEIKYNTMYSLRLIFLKGLYEALYIGLHSDVSNKCLTFQRSNHPAHAYQASIFAKKLRYKIEDNYKDIIALNPMIWPCNALTDGKEHDSKDYKFEYLFGDPSKVDDPNIRNIIFGDPKDYYVPACKNLNNFIAKDLSRKDVLADYHVFDAESKWYMVTMGDSKVYVEICGDKSLMEICSLINPSRGICIVRS